MTSVSLTLTDVTVRRRGQVILGPISHEFETTGLTVILGPNGAGKSTLLKALHGVDRLSSGAVSWSIPGADPHQAQAYVFQAPIVLRRSVFENLAYPLRLIKAPRAEIQRKVIAWAGRTGLGDVLDRSALRLSGGEKQKLALARALIRNPKVLFLDEPCSNLDGRATKDIEALLKDALAEGTRIIMTTHDLGQARRLATDVVFLRKGQLCEARPAGAFFSGPEMKEAQAFLNGEIVE